MRKKNDPAKEELRQLKKDKKALGRSMKSLRQERQSLKAELTRDLKKAQKASKKVRKQQKKDAQKDLSLTAKETKATLRALAKDEKSKLSQETVDRTMQYREDLKANRRHAKQMGKEFKSAKTEYKRKKVEFKTGSSYEAHVGVVLSMLAGVGTIAALIGSRVVEKQAEAELAGEPVMLVDASEKTAADTVETTEEEAK